MLKSWLMLEKQSPTILCLLSPPYLPLSLSPLLNLIKKRKKASIGNKLNVVVVLAKMVQVGRILGKHLD